MATTIDRLHGAYTPDATRAATPDFAWHAYAVVVAATMVVVGLIWDISWHMSIGRDTFWTPAHLLIQSGGLIAGLSSGFIALRTTFRGTSEEKASAVAFWGFRAPFGAWVCVLGCGAMLASAPFDDWWHNAYGLDVRIISPPHILLGLGMLGIVLGAMLRTLALQNGDNERTRVLAARLFALATGLWVSIVGVMMMEWANRWSMHSGSFYSSFCMTMPIIFCAAAVAGKSRHPATTAALVYTVILLGTSLVLTLFPATPKLGPIYQDITHYVPLDFPILLVVPALAVDLIWRRARTWRTLSAAAALGFVFLTTLFAVQWPFATFLQAHGRNWFFHTDNFVYWRNPESIKFAFQFRGQSTDDLPLLVELAYAFALATGASVIGISRGRWMQRIRR